MPPPGRTCLLPGAAQTYACGVIAKPLINNFSQAVKTGFITVIMRSKLAGKLITVGNASSPWYQNKTFIKSFEMGGTNDVAARFQIYDASGNDLSTFLDSLYQDSCNAQHNTVLLEFGWIMTNSSGVATKFSSADFTYAPYASINRRAKPNPGGALGFLVKNIKVSVDAQGVCLYDVELSTLLARKNGRVRNAEAVGSNQHPASIKVAASKALERTCNQRGVVNNTAVLFVREDAGVLTEFGFPRSEGGFAGPKSVWDPNRLSSVGAIRNWLNGLRTDRGLGMTVYTDPSIDAANVVVIEANPEWCQNPRVLYCPQKDSPKYIYIVNGGDCSPVIKFTPTVTYMAAARAQGGGTGAQSSKQIQSSSRRASPCPEFVNNSLVNPEESAEGLQTHVTVPGASMNYRFPTDAVERQAVAINANLVANAGRIQSTNIEGELEIQGNPEYVNIARCVGMKIGIIYFNVGMPSVLQQPGVRGINAMSAPMDWLANPNVNNVFSRLDYQITGVSHSISDNGDFTTKIKVMAVPAAAKRRRTNRGAQ